MRLSGTWTATGEFAWSSHLASSSEGDEQDADPRVLQDSCRRLIRRAVRLCPEQLKFAELLGRRDARRTDVQGSLGRIAGLRFHFSSFR